MAIFTLSSAGVPVSETYIWQDFDKIDKTAKRSLWGTEMVWIDFTRLQIGIDQMQYNSLQAINILHDVYTMYKNKRGCYG